MNRVRDVTSASKEIACCRCGQQDGPFLDRWHAEYVLQQVGWRCVPKVETWVDGAWELGHSRDWHCVNCLFVWQRLRRAKQKLVTV